MYLNYRIIAFDKHTSQQYSEGFFAKNSAEHAANMKNFEENVSFTKWYYQIELDDEYEDVFVESVLLDDFDQIV